MRESLICIGKIGKKGYYFEDTGIQIFPMRNFVII